jgi:transposase
MRPLYVRKLTTEEYETLTQGLRSPSAFTVRRSQILLKSHEKQKPQTIAQALHCSDQTVRVAIHAFNETGVSCLAEKSHARHDQAPLLDEAGCERLQELVRISPRTFGHETSVWTRPLLAQQLHQEGYTNREVSETSVSNALARVDISWRRAKKWIHSPDPHYDHRKKDGTT